MKDVVLIKEDSPRGNWKLGRISKLLKSNDGEIRAAKVIVSSGNEIGRSLNCLYPLEMSNDEDCDENKMIKSDVLVKENRPIRKTAIKAKEKIKKMIEDESTM